MTLFEFTDVIFDRKAYQSVDNKTKRAFFFNLNRFLSHKYPIEINDTNNLVGINKDHVPYLVDYWHRFLISKFTRKPDFFFWKTSIEPLEKTFLDKFDKEVIVGYMKFYMVSKATLDVMCNIFPEEIELELKYYKDTMDAKSRKNPKKK